ncbi:hypothetical protein GTW51_23075 [Aurantimonas aggregata]|uniref:Uncharacterized protein n=1 Tax=Aurantimonas aggregata TaxID=2047720 RepID=A0A6L9MNZ1_9HYPH|nr:hypothetical protein [Aurantimonas aggregata]
MARVVDDQAKAPTCRKERQAVATIIFICASLAEAGDYPFAHLSLDERRLDPETLTDNRRIDLDGAVFELDPWHFQLH